MRRNISACANSDSACRLSTHFVISNLCASSSACLTWSIWSFKLLISSPSTSLRCSYYSSELEYFCSRSYQTHGAYSFFQMPLLCSQLASDEEQYITLLQITMCVCVCVCVRVCACVCGVCMFGCDTCWESSRPDFNFALLASNASTLDFRASTSL